jgi:hypothetical protein
VKRTRREAAKRRAPSHAEEERVQEAWRAKAAHKTGDFAVSDTQQAILGREVCNLVLHLGRRRGARLVQELVRIGRYETEHDAYSVDVIFRANETRRSLTEGPRQGIGSETGLEVRGA